MTAENYEVMRFGRSALFASAMRGAATSCYLCCFKFQSSGKQDNTVLCYRHGELVMNVGHNIWWRRCHCSLYCFITSSQVAKRTLFMCPLGVAKCCRHGKLVMNGGHYILWRRCHCCLYCFTTSSEVAKRAAFTLQAW